MADHECKYQEHMEQMALRVGEIHASLLGTLKEPERGLMPRVQHLENWRSSVTTRTKNKIVWVWGLIGSVIGGGVVVIGGAVALKWLKLQ